MAPVPSSVADTLRQLNRTTFSSQPVVPGTGSSVTIPWGIIIGLLVGVTLACIAFKLFVSKAPTPPQASAPMMAAPMMAPYAPQLSAQQVAMRLAQTAPSAPQARQLNGLPGPLNGSPDVPQAPTPFLPPPVNHQQPAIPQVAAPSLPMNDANFTPL